MLRDTPALRGKIEDPRSRDSNNTVKHKAFAGGHLSIAGANSPAGLASRPIRIILADEIDRYPQSAGSEGDPVSLGTKRTRTFWNRKIVMVSSPTVKHISRIERAYNESDMRQYHVPCGACGESQVLKWKQVRWNNPDGSDAHYVCEHCGVLWTDVQRWSYLKKGKWIARRETNRIAGFHLSEIYSPWIDLGEMAGNFLRMKKSQDTLRVFINTSLAETFDELAQDKQLNAHSLIARVENYSPDKIPDGVLLITAAADVQDDRIEVEVLGWGLGDETWHIEYLVLYGDPSAPAIWQELDDVFSRTYNTKYGERKIEASCVDSGGHYTQKVMEFCEKRWHRRVYAIKGVAGQGKPIWVRSKNKKHLYLVGVDDAKMNLYQMLKIEKPQGGYCHFPASCDEQYFDMLTAEVPTIKLRKGFEVIEWVLPPNKRNEALDVRIYNIAARKSLNLNLAKRIKQPSKVTDNPIPKKKVEASNIDFSDLGKRGGGK